jgi:glycosyltransferase involved in cell wall biosynthesis
VEIWIFCQYASVPSIGQYTGHFDLAKGLVAKGHEVTIFASSFSHYSFSETLLEAGEKRRDAVYDGVRFVWLRTPEYHRNDWRRVRSMGVYAWRATWAGLRLGAKPDICVGVCVHPLAGLAAWLVAAVKGIPFVYEIRDLWPLVLIERGHLRSDSLVAKTLYRLEHFLVQRAARVIGAWRYFDRYIAEIGGDPKKVEWIPQIADLDRRPSSVPPPPEGGPFTVMYTGGHTTNNGIDVMLSAAGILQRRGVDDVRFVFIGGGQEKPKLVNMAAELALANVEFRDPVSKDQLYGSMTSAHAFIASLRAYPHHSYGMCINKICDYLAMERPIIYATRSSYNPVAEAGAGIAIEPESPERMADAIVDLKNTPREERLAMGHRGYRHLIEYHERGRMTERLEQILLATCVSAHESKDSDRPLVGDMKRQRACPTAPDQP